MFGNIMMEEKRQWTWTHRYWVHTYLIFFQFISIHCLENLQKYRSSSAEVSGTLHLFSRLWAWQKIVEWLALPIQFLENISFNYKCSIVYFIIPCFSPLLQHSSSLTRDSFSPPPRALSTIICIPKDRKLDMDMTRFCRLLFGFNQAWNWGS